jgi:hypothetical protein
MKLASILAAGAALALSLSPAAAGGNGPSCTAVVDADGTLERGLNATGVIHSDLGIYEVDFTKDVTACNWTATIGLSGTAGASDPGTVTVVGRSGNAKGLYIQTFNNKGHPTDLGFHVIVAC